MHKGKRYCSAKCVHFDELNLTGATGDAIAEKRLKPALG
jgi:hypothetical protein